MQRIIRLPLAVLALAVLMLAGCGGSSADNTTPDGAVKAIVAALQANDLKALMTTVLPPKAMDEMRKEFEEGKQDGMSDQEKAQFNSMLAMITVDGAEDNLYAMIKDQLPEYQGYLQMAPGLLAMAAQNPDLSPEEQKEVAEGVAAVQAWAAGVDLTDEAKVKQAIGIVCDTVRNSGIKNADDIVALSFDDALGKGSDGLAAAKTILALYDLDMDSMLGSVSVGTPTVEGEQATVPVTVTAFGKTSTSPVVLKQFEGKWYQAEVADEM